MEPLRNELAQRIGIGNLRSARASAERERREGDRGTAQPDERQGHGARHLPLVVGLLKALEVSDGSGFAHGGRCGHFVMLYAREGARPSLM